MIPEPGQSAAESTPFKLESTLASHQRWVWDCAFSADSAYLVTACSDHYARLWELHSETIIRQYNGHHRGLNFNKHLKTCADIIRSCLRRSEWLFRSSVKEVDEWIRRRYRLAWIWSWSVGRIAFIRCWLRNASGFDTKYLKTSPQHIWIFASTCPSIGTVDLILHLVPLPTVLLPLLFRYDTSDVLYDLLPFTFSYYKIWVLFTVISCHSRGISLSSSLIMAPNYSLMNRVFWALNKSR